MRRRGEVSVAAAVAALLVVAACGDTTSPPEPTTGGTSPRADSPDVDDRCVAAAELEQALTQLADTNDLDVHTEADGWESGDVRDAADGLQRSADAAERLADLVDGEQRAALVTWARPHRQLAELYRELDHDLERIDPDDTAQMDRLADASAGVLVGPEWPAGQRAAFDRLLDELAAACPQLELVRQLDAGTDRGEQADTSTEVGDHAVTLSDAAVRAIEAEAATTLEALAGVLGDDTPPPSPCPLWDPAVVTAAAGDLLDDRIQLSDTVGERQGSDQWWMFACGSVDARPDPTTGPRGPVSVAARPLEGPRSILEDATPQQLGGHDVFATAPADGVHGVFAVDVDHDLLLLVRAGSAPLAEAVLAAVLDHLTDSG